MTDTRHHEEESSPGVMASARGAIVTLIEIFKTRLQVLGADVEEQAQRLLQVLLWGFATVCLFVLGLVACVVLIMLALWDSNRPLAAVLVLAILFGAGLVSAWVCLRRLRAGPPPFETSIAELHKDLDHLRTKP